MLPVFCMSERKIFPIVFAEIHGLCPDRDPFARIIPESDASGIVHADASLGAENGAIVQFCAVTAVGAGFFDLFPKQHVVRLFSHDS